MRHYGKLMMFRKLKWGHPSEAPDVIAGFHSGTLQPKDESKYLAASLNFSYILPMTVKAVLELGIPDILAKAGGGKPLSAPEILAKLPTKSIPGPTSFSNLRRLMRPLVLRGVFSETLNSENQPAYGLTEISKWYVRDNELSLAPHADLVFTRPIQSMFGRLHEIILDENANPFAVEHGMFLYQYFKKYPELTTIFDKGITSFSKPDISEVADTLQDNGWLEGVKTLVDVGGGGVGNVVGEIVSRNPHIQGINFDQPHVVEGAPEVKGVHFVGGEFFKAVPSGDAIILKYIIHNYGDEACIRILKNCFEALPKRGKLILAEVLVKDLDNSPKASFVVAMDIVMMGCLPGGRERTKDECQKLMQAAGFSQFRVFESQTTSDLIFGIKEE